MTFVLPVDRTQTPQPVARHKPTVLATSVTPDLTVGHAPHATPGRTNPRPDPTSAPRVPNFRFLTPAACHCKTVSVMLDILDQTGVPAPHVNPMHTLQMLAPQCAQRARHFRVRPVQVWRWVLACATRGTLSQMEAPVVRVLRELSSPAQGPRLAPAAR